MKIDVSKITGYSTMSDAEKLKALENYSLPDPDYSGYVKKELFDRTASELATKKKELSDRMTEDERTKEAEREAREALQKAYDALLHESQVSKNKAELIALGYDEKLADTTAEAMVNGDFAKVMANQKVHLQAMEKRLQEQILLGTKKPVPDGGSNTMTLEAFRKLSTVDRLQYAQTNPEGYKALYTGGKR